MRTTSPPPPQSRYGSLPSRGASQFLAAMRHGFGRPGGTTENSPALECWVRGAPTRKSRRDDRVSGKLGRPSLSGLGSSPIADPALKCWAIAGRPCGTTPRRQPWPQWVGRACPQPRHPSGETRPSPSPHEARMGRGPRRGVLRPLPASRGGGAPPLPIPLLRSERRRGSRSHGMDDNPDCPAQPRL